MSDLVSAVGGGGNLGTVLRFVALMTVLILTYLKSRQANNADSLQRIEAKLDRHLGDHASAEVNRRRFL